MKRISTLNKNLKANSFARRHFTLFNETGGVAANLNPGGFGNVVFEGDPGVNFVFTFQAGENFKQEFRSAGHDFFLFPIPAGVDSFFLEYFEPETGLKETMKFSAQGFQTASF